MLRVYSPRPAAKRAQRTTILLVDDDPFLAFARRKLLARVFSDVLRVASAAEAFILIEDHEFADSVRMVVAGLHLPGMAGPAFVNELVRRLPETPILVLGRPGEIAPDYAGENVRFLPSYASQDDMLAGALDLLEEFLPHVA